MTTSRWCHPPLKRSPRSGLSLRRFRTLGRVTSPRAVLAIPDSEIAGSAAGEVDFRAVRNRTRQATRASASPRDRARDNAICAPELSTPLCEGGGGRGVWSGRCPRRDTRGYSADHRSDGVESGGDSAPRRRFLSVQLRVVTDQPWDVKADVLAIPIVGDPTFDGTLGEMDRRAGGELRALVQFKEIQGKRYWTA